MNFLRRTIATTDSSSRDAIANALHELAPDVQRWCARHLGPRSDLEDAVQEALIAVADALTRFRNESSMRTYAYRIVLRSAYRYRTQHREAQRSQQLHVALDVDNMTPESLAMERESVRRLYAALDSLTELRRNAFVLCAIEQMPHDEAAAIEDVSIDTLRARLQHARSDLTEVLKRDPYLGSMWKETP